MSAGRADGKGRVMLHFLRNRLLRAVATVLIAVTGVFMLLRVAGDPAAIMLPPETPPDVRAAYRTQWGLDRPLPEQYAIFLAGVLRGDLGTSFGDGRAATEIVAAALPKSLMLGASAFLLALAVGLPLGLVAALERNSRIDRLVMTIAVMGYATPVFFLGILLILLFALDLRVLPSAGSATWAHLVLPTLTLGLPLAGRLARFVRTSALEVLGKPFIRAARAKGVRRLGVLLRHAAPNAAAPVLMFLGIEIGLVLAGGAVTETIFAWPGLGWLLVQSVTVRDLPVVQAAILTATLIMVIANIAVDLAHAWIDPRLDLAGGRPAAGR